MTLSNVLKLYLNTTLCVKGMLSVDLPMIYYQKIEHLVTLITISSNKYQTKSDLKTKKMSDTQILVVFVFPLNPQ